jgi:hypothetical protein
MRQNGIFSIFMVTLAVLHLCWLAELSAQATNGHALKAMISLDKEEFQLNEAIWLTIRLENISKDRIIGASADPVYRLVRIEVVSRESDTLYGGCGHAMFGAYPTLDPGQKDLYFVRLVGPTCYYGVEHEDALYYGRLIPEGEYELQGKVWYNYQGENTPIFTNKLTFKVKAVRPEEEGAYDLLLEGHKKLYPEKKRNEGAELIWRMIRQYPKSAYTLTAYELVLFEFDEHPELALEFIDKYPNSGLVASVIFAVTPRAGKSTERKKFLENIVKNYPNTKAALYADNQLDKWRRGKIWVDEPIR